MDKLSVPSTVKFFIYLFIYLFLTFLGILYLHKSHNKPILPPKHLHRHRLRFFLGHHVPGKVANNDYAKFWRVKEMYYGVCASRQCSKKEKKEANSKLSKMTLYSAISNIPLHNL